MPFSTKQEKQTNSRLDELKARGAIKDYSLFARNYIEVLELTLPTGEIITVRSSHHGERAVTTCLDIQ